MAIRDARHDPLAWGGSVEFHLARIAEPFVALLDQERSRRVSTLRFGDHVRIHKTERHWTLLAGVHDDYLGWAKALKLSDFNETKLRTISNSSAILFSEPDIKTSPNAFLSMGSKIEAETHNDEFVKTPAGYISAHHIAPRGDAVDYALQLLDVPYLWGGGTHEGIDCSGLTQLCYGMMGFKIPRDADQQEAALKEISTDEPKKRGDLVYWKGHVGLLEDEQTMVHATAFAMRTIRENLDEAIARIGEPTGYRRVV